MMQPGNHALGFNLDTTLLATWPVTFNSRYTKDTLFYIFQSHKKLPFNLRLCLSFCCIGMMSNFLKKSSNVCQ